MERKTICEPEMYSSYILLFKWFLNFHNKLHKIKLKFPNKKIVLILKISTEYY